MDRPAKPTPRVRLGRLKTSRETSFNVTSALMVNAVIVFLPERLQESPYIINAITAWFALGNIALKYLSYGAVEYWRHRRELLRAQFNAGPLQVTTSITEKNGDTPPSPAP